MNVFRHELRQRFKSILVWLAVMAVFIAAAMVKYDTFRGGGKVVNELLNSFPSTLKAVFGMSGLDLTSISGYTGVTYIFIAVMAAIFAGMLGSNAIAREETGRTVEFLYPKPVSRWTVLAQKLLVVGIGIAAMTVTIYATLLAVTSPYNIDSTTHAALVNFSLAALYIMLLSGGLGLMFAAVSRRSARGATLLAIVIVASYFVFALSKMSTDFEWLALGSMFSWFDAVEIIKQASLPVTQTIVSIALSTVSVVIAFIALHHRDMC